MLSKRLVVILFAVCLLFSVCSGAFPEAGTAEAIDPAPAFAGNDQEVQTDGYQGTGTTNDKILKAYEELHGDDPINPYGFVIRFFHIINTERVWRVAGGSAASKAGLKTNDVITGVDETRISSRYTLAEILSAKEIGDTVTFHIDRYGKEIDIDYQIDGKTERTPEPTCSPDERQ